MMDLYTKNPLMNNNMNPPINKNNSNMNSPMNNSNINSPMNNSNINSPMNNNNMNLPMNNNNMNSSMNNNNILMNNYVNYLNAILNYYHFFNNINKANTDYFNQMKFDKKNSLTNFKGLLPRKNFEINNDDFPGYQGIKYNIYFQSPSGNKVPILCPNNIKIKDLLRKYVSKIGLGENVIDNAIYFLFNGAKLNSNDNRTIEDIRMYNNTIIIVIDRAAVIGA